MAHLIDKSALLAEIEKYYNECLKRAKITDPDYWNAKADAYRNVLAILDDILEVKEVDLDEQDIYNILILERFVLREVGDKECSNEKICKEVLKRFKSYGKKEI